MSSYSCESPIWGEIVCDHPEPLNLAGPGVELIKNPQGLASGEGIIGNKRLARAGEFAVKLAAAALAGGGLAYLVDQVIFPEIAQAQGGGQADWCASNGLDARTAPNGDVYCVLHGQGSSVAAPAPAPQEEAPYYGNPAGQPAAVESQSVNPYPANLDSNTGRDIPEPPSGCNYALQPYYDSNYDGRIGSSDVAFAYGAGGILKAQQVAACVGTQLPQATPTSSPGVIETTWKGFVAGQQALRDSRNACIEQAYRESTSELGPFFGAVVGFFDSFGCP